MSEPNTTTTLPNELLVHIFESVSSDYNEQIHTFSNLARVCRHFESLATPLLYRHVRDCCWRHLQLFGRTITANKGLAELVRFFHEREDNINSTPIKYRCSTSGNTYDPNEPLLNAARSQLKPLAYNRSGLVAPYLYSLCPKVKTLEARESVNHLLAHVGKLMDDEETIKPLQFQWLRSLHLSIVNDERGYNMDSVSLVFNLPLLRVLKISNAALSREEEQSSSVVQDSWRCERRTSAVEELTFEGCNLPVSWTLEAISSCRILKHFDYEYYYNADVWDLYPRCFEALTVHQDSLVFIRINEMYGCKLHSKIHTWMPVKIVSFRDYSLLTHLDVPMFQLSLKEQRCIIQDKLPSSLEVLRVDVRSVRDNSSDDFFIALAEAVPSHLLSLKSVKIVCRIEEYYETGYLPLHFCHIRRMLASRGVELLFRVEFIACEFKAEHMRGIRKTIKSSGPDGCEIVKNSSWEVGCLKPLSYDTLSCYERDGYTGHARNKWGYMAPGSGPEEFELLI